MNIHWDLRLQITWALMIRLLEVCPLPSGWLAALICFKSVTHSYTAEGRAVKRFQKSTSERNLPLRRTEPVNPATNKNEARPLLGHQRRQSVRDSKAPPTTATLQSSPSKRYFWLVSKLKFTRLTELNLGLHMTLRSIDLFPNLRCLQSAKSTHIQDKLR